MQKVIIIVTLIVAIFLLTASMASAGQGGFNKPAGQGGFNLPAGQGGFN